MPTRRIRSGCCARASSGHEVADPAITLMKSRRRIAFTKAGTTPNRTRLQQGFTTGGMGSEHHFVRQQSSGPNVRFVPKADIRSGLEVDGAQHIGRRQRTRWDNLQMSIAALDEARPDECADSPR